MRIIFPLLLFFCSISFSQNLNLGEQYIKNKEYVKAAKFFESYLPLIKKEVGKESTGYLGVMYVIADCYAKAKDIRKAELVYSQALNLYESSIILQKKTKSFQFIKDYVSILLELSLELQIKEDFKNTEILLNKTNKIINKYNLEDKNRLSIYAAYYHLYNKTGNVNLYLDYAAKSVNLSKQVFGEISIEHLISLMNFTTALNKTKKNDQALIVLEKAFTVFEKLNIEEIHLLTCQLFILRAIIFQDLEMLNKAEKDLIMVLRTLVKLEDDYHQKKQISGSALLNLGSVNYQMRRFEKSIKFFESALLLYNTEFPTNSLNIANIENHLANSYSSLSNHIKARQYYFSSLRKAVKNYKNIYYSLSEEEKYLFLNIKIGMYFSSFTSFIANNHTSNSLMLDELYNVVLFRKNQLLRSTLALKKDINKSGDNNLKLKFEKWIHLKKKISKLYQIEKGDKSETLSKLEIQSNNLEKTLTLKSEKFNSFTNNNATKWTDVKKRLKKNEAAIEFIYFSNFDKKWTGERHYCALIVKQNSKHPELVFLFKENELNETLNKNNLNATDNIRNEKLYSLIWKPIEEQMVDIKNIYYSPSGILHNISFDALSNHNSFLNKKHNLIRLTSTTKIGKSKFTLDNSINALLFGDIDYGSQSGKWKYLKGTKLEINAISKILKRKKIKQKIYNGKNASKDALKENITNKQIVHIATHGFFRENSEIKLKEEFGKVNFDNSRGNSSKLYKQENSLMNSGLIFANANDSNKGVLTAMEVSNMDLNDTEIVVLSACETGLGDIKGTEGVYGLQRAFKMAGAEYLIVSLWKIPDFETNEFMTLFYELLLEEENIESAFTKAQRQMSKKYSSYYWSGFILIR